MSWTLIEHQALSSSVASVTLGSGGTIPQTYKTLKLVCSVRLTRATNGGAMQIQLNSSTSNFSGRFVLGSGSAASSSTVTRVVGEVDGANDTASTFGNMEITFPNYAGSTNKPYSVDSVNENNATEAYQRLTAGLWSDTAAITSMVFTDAGAGNIASGSTFTLYGLA